MEARPVSLTRRAMPMAPGQFHRRHMLATSRMQHTALSLSMAIRTDTLLLCRVTSTRMLLQPADTPTQSRSRNSIRRSNRLQEPPVQRAGTPSTQVLLRERLARADTSAAGVAKVSPGRLV